LDKEEDVHLLRKHVNILIDIKNIVIIMMELIVINKLNHIVIIKINLWVKMINVHLMNLLYNVDNH